VVGAADKQDIKKLGRILVDFVNAATIDEACFSYFDHIRNLFSFGPSFENQIKKAFPSPRSFAEPLNEIEKALLEFILKESTILQYLNQQFSRIDYELESYDPHNRTISLVSLKWERDDAKDLMNDAGRQGVRLNSGGFLDSLMLLGLSAVDGPISVKIDAIKDEIKDIMEPDTQDQIKQLIEVGHSIDELACEFSEKRLKHLYDLAPARLAIVGLQAKIEKIRAETRSIFEMITAGKALGEIPAFLNLLEIYNSMPKNQVALGDNDVMITVPPIHESKYLRIDAVQDWPDVLADDFVYCLVEFFRHEKGRKYLRKCQACHNYFVPNRLNIQKFCKPKCRQSSYRRKSR